MLPPSQLHCVHTIVYYHAIAGTEDYSAFQFVPLTFDAGSVSGAVQCHVVEIVDDNVLEENETFSVTLSSSTEPAFLGSNLTQSMVTIRRDPVDCKIF